MMKFVKGNLENIQGVEIFPLISLIIFFTFFVGLFFYVFTRKKDYLEEVSHMPLDKDDEANEFNLTQNDNHS